MFVLEYLVYWSNPSHRRRTVTDNVRCARTMRNHCHFLPIHTFNIFVNIVTNSRNYAWFPQRVSNNFFHLLHKFLYQFYRSLINDESWSLYLRFQRMLFALHQILFHSNRNVSLRNNTRVFFKKSWKLFLILSINIARANLCSFCTWIKIAWGSNDSFIEQRLRKASFIYSR